MGRSGSIRLVDNRQGNLKSFLGSLRFVMTHKLVLAFDTSTLNRLVSDSDSETSIAAILSGYEVLLPEMSVDELYATPDAEHRKRLFSVCRRLLGVGQCALPAHWMIDALVRRYHAERHTFDWKSVPVRAQKIEQAVHDDSLLNDEEMVQQHRAFVRKLQKDLEKMFQVPR
jgi:hypothetical protein